MPAGCSRVEVCGRGATSWRACRGAYGSCLGWRPRSFLHLTRRCLDPPPAGCGFLDTVAALVELGADVNARDCTDCTPLQASWQWGAAAALLGAAWVGAGLFAHKGCRRMPWAAPGPA